MQTSSEQLAEDHDHSSDVAIMAQNFEDSVRLNEYMGTQKKNFEGQESSRDAEGNEEDETEDIEEFSFTFDGANTSIIAAEDAFLNGQIRPMFPLFNRDLLLEEGYFDENLTVNPKVKKVLVEMSKHSSGTDEISGPYCEWKRKPPPTAAEREVCKKSNSTGFSKLWKLKELVNRSNSDGRDAFVLLNNKNVAALRRKEDEKDTRAVAGGGKVEASVVSKDKEKMKKGGKKKTTTLSAHEVYLKNKAKENDRRKSYMPYKPEVVGFFTNVNGGISKNVHPY